MIALGVDPGLTGAAALVCIRRGILEVVDLPVEPNGSGSGSMRSWLDAPAFFRVLRELADRHDLAREAVHCAIERPIAMPTLPAQTIASQFDTFGALRAILATWSHSQRLEVVEARDWKRGYGLKGGKVEKTASRDCCLRLYPDAPVKLVKHHNRAEAILIARYALRFADDAPRATPSTLDLLGSF